MNINDAIRSRRSVKTYDPSHVIQDSEIRELIKLAQLSPSSFNIQHVRFIHISDPDLRKAIRAAAWDQAQVTDASALFILCADVKAWNKEPSRYWKNAPQPVQDAIIPMIGPFYQDKDWLQRDEALRSVGLSAQTLMLAAQGMGYDTCPMIGFDLEKVATLVNLPDDHIIGMMITMGKALKPAYERGGLLSIDEVMIENKFK